MESKIIRGEKLSEQEQWDLKVFGHDYPKVLMKVHILQMIIDPEIQGPKPQTIIKMLPLDFQFLDPISRAKAISKIFMKFEKSRIQSLYSHYRLE